MTYDVAAICINYQKSHSFAVILSPGAPQGLILIGREPSRDLVSTVLIDREPFVMKPSPGGATGQLCRRFMTKF